MAAGFGAYRQVLGTPEARAFTAAGFAARLPMSMTGLGIVLFISITSGSYGRAGLVTAVATLTTAVVRTGLGPVDRPDRPGAGADRRDDHLQPEHRRADHHACCWTPRSR